MFGFYNWLRRFFLKHALIPTETWREVLNEVPLCRNFSVQEIQRLRELVTFFIHEKTIQGAGGLEITDRMRLIVAIQACIPILNLGMDYYEGWYAVIVYPVEFISQHQWMDTAGVMHTSERILSGESWSAGPVVLSWKTIVSDTTDHTDGDNVVIHEFAHKLDMLNGATNGMPPLHQDMNAAEWTDALAHAYEDLSTKIRAGEPTVVDAYAATGPGEFFAVISEGFFEIPDCIQDTYPDVYRQLSQFYRQDPVRRLTA